MPSKPRRIISGLKKTFIKITYIFERTNNAEIRREEPEMRKRRVAGRIYGTKYSWKGYKDRNRHKNRIKRSGQAPFIIIIIIIIYPLTARVVWAPQMISQPVFSTFSCSPLPSGTCRTPGLSIPWCPPTSSSVCLVFFPFSLCLARWFWSDPINGKHVHTPTVYASSCGPIACWILAHTSSLATWSLYEMCSILQ